MKAVPPQTPPTATISRRQAARVWWAGMAMTLPAWAALITDQR